MPAKKKEVYFFYSNRAEKGILEPVIKKVDQSKKFNATKVDLMMIPISVKEYGMTYTHTYKLLEENQPDLCFCSFDRPEMIFVALASFYQGIPVAQMHAGDISQHGSWDDFTRHAISVYASIHFCNGMPSYYRVLALLHVVGKEATHVYEVGSTAFDDIEIDESTCPTEPYDLVVYNPPTRRRDLIPSEVNKIADMLDKKTVWIEPNGDLGSAIIKATTLVRDIKLAPTVKRPQFLGLMKNAERFIGNSSSLFKEAPAFLKPHQLIHVGVRNAGREKLTKIRKGGSARIVKILEELNLSDL